MKRRWKIMFWVFGAAVGIFLLLVTVTVSNVSMGPHPHAMLDATRASLTAIQTALALFRHDYGRFPTQDEGLQTLVPGATRSLPTDAWGTSIRYRLMDGKPVVDSAGPDQQFDTIDDIKK